MVQLPTDPMDAMREFFAAGDEVVGHMKKAARLSRTGDDRALFKELLGEIDSQRRELEAILPKAFRDAQGRLDGALSRLDKLRSRKDVVLAKAEALTKVIDQQIASGREAVKNEAAKPKVPPPRPRKGAEKAPADLMLAPGKELCLLLSHLSPLAPPKLSQPTRVSGNIWENWGPMGLPATHPASETPLLDELHEGSSPWS